MVTKLSKIKKRNVIIKVTVQFMMHKIFYSSINSIYFKSTYLKGHSNLKEEQYRRCLPMYTKVPVSR